MTDLPGTLVQFWENASQFWTTPSARIQAFAFLLSVTLAWITSKSLKPTVLRVTHDPSRPAWIERSVRILANLLLPLCLLLFSLFLRGILDRFSLSSIDLLNPFVHATTAWLIYRLVAGLTHNRFWLRVVAVLAFGMAALQSFGLLEPTFAILGSVSFAVGKSSFHSRFGKRYFHPTVPTLDEFFGR